jgi:hypothetical protein
MRGARDNRGDRDTRGRLGSGDFISPGPNPYARALFLETVGQCVPEAFRALATVQREDDAALRDWADQWGFTDDWTLQAARGLQTLWCDTPGVLAFVVATCAWEPVFPPGPTWNPVTESEDAYRIRVDAHIERVKHMAGMIPTPEKRTGTVHFEWTVLHHVGKKRQAEIVEIYQDGSGHPDVSAVSRAITETAALIGLTLRPGRGRKLSQTRQT